MLASGKIGATTGKRSIGGSTGGNSRSTCLVRKLVIEGNRRRRQKKSRRVWKPKDIVQKQDMAKERLPLISPRALAARTLHKPKTQVMTIGTSSPSVCNNKAFIPRALLKTARLCKHLWRKWRMTTISGKSCNQDGSHAGLIVTTVPMVIQMKLTSSAVGKQ
mmetsp:Transcript_104545/g.181565  ORF Transcript_104545/g.181565 Transcript_104545/m.181565 type:complete len:162 (-) Transcript_104545:329-814(-)